MPPDDHNDERWAAYVGFSEFFSMLSSDDQRFIAVASTTAELWPELMRFARDQDATELILSENIRPESLLDVLEISSGELVAYYLHKSEEYLSRKRVSPQRSDPFPVSSEIRHAIEEMRRELVGDLENFSESMKAAQMEILRISEGRSVADTDALLLQSLGRLVSYLLPETRQMLKISEAAYRNARTTYDEHFSTMLLLQAFEAEFMYRVRRVLAEELIKAGQSDYPQTGSAKLVESKKLNGKLTAGKVLYLLRADKQLQAILAASGLNAEEVIDRSVPAVELRNKVFHHTFLPEYVLLARDLLLGEKSAFRAIISNRSEEQTRA